MDSSVQPNGSMFKNLSNTGIYDATMWINVTIVIEINKNGLLKKFLLNTDFVSDLALNNWKFCQL